MSRVLPIVLAVGLLAGLALPATAEEEQDDADCYFLQFDEEGNPLGPEFCTLQVWLKENDLRVGNLGAFDMGLPTWNTEEPDSVTTGAGGMYVGSSEIDVLFEQSAEGGATFEGEFTGHIDTIAMDLYAFFPFRGTLGGQHTVRVLVEVNDVWVWSTSGEQAVPIEWVEDGYGVFRFSISGLETEMGFSGIETGPDVTNTVRINVSPWFIPDDDALYVYGAEEAPSGIVFNIQEGREDYTPLF